MHSSTTVSSELVLVDLPCGRLKVSAKTRLGFAPLDSYLYLLRICTWRIFLRNNHLRSQHIPPQEKVCTSYLTPPEHSFGHRNQNCPCSLQPTLTLLDADHRLGRLSFFKPYVLEAAFVPCINWICHIVMLTWHCILTSAAIDWRLDKPGRPSMTVHVRRPMADRHTHSYTC